ncbi:hypothetical protein BB558_007659 [Smittium angustum]|nr:hypothetical protein BB558_007659 [Smittium angustum]
MRRVLYPQRLAVYVMKNFGPARPQNEESKIEKEKALEAKQTTFAPVVEKPNTEALLKKLELISTLKFSRKPVGKSVEGESQQIYGSVTKNDIVAYLRNTHDIVLSKESLECEERMKTIGNHDCIVNIDGNTKHKLIVSIEPLENSGI